MNISHRTLEGEVVLVQLEGRLDAAANLELRLALQKLLNKKSPKLILDLREVPFIDSSGLAALVSALRLAREKGGNIALCRIRPQAQTVFRLTMIDRIFSIHPSPEEAKQSLI